LLLKNEIEFEYINITESMRTLKIFLALRDKAPYFDKIKASGSVGIPTIVVGEGEEFINGSSDIDFTKLK
jgi:glutaredoxin-related protein